MALPALARIDSDSLEVGISLELPVLASAVDGPDAESQIHRPRTRRLHHAGNRVFLSGDERHRSGAERRTLRLHAAQQRGVASCESAIDNLLLGLVRRRILRAPVIPAPALEVLLEASVHQEIARRRFGDVHRVESPEVEPAHGRLRRILQRMPQAEIENEPPFHRMALPVFFPEVGN